MAEQEYRGLLTNIRADGEREILIPITDKACVRGMEEVDAHVASRSNPHGVTAAQIGAEKAGAVGTHAASPDAHRALFDAKADKKVSKEVAAALGLDPETATVDEALYAAGSHIVLDILFLNAFVGKQYQITGPGITGAITGIVPESKRIRVPVLEVSSRYTLTCNGISLPMDVDQYYGPYKFLLALPLKQNTPAVIKEIGASGRANLIWNIGDEIDLTLSDGEKITFQIYDFNHDTLTTGGLAPITFGMKGCMKKNHKMNNTATNVGGWPGSSMYSYLNTTVYNKLPQEWRSIIRPVKKLTSEGNGSKQIRSSNDKLFLLCEEEIFGMTTYAAAGEGKQYPIFTDDKNRRKGTSNGREFWWERSPATGNNAHFCHVNGLHPNTDNANYEYPGVSFCFCV